MWGYHLITEYQQIGEELLKFPLAVVFIQSLYLFSLTHPVDK